MTAQILGLRDVGEALLADVMAHPDDVAPRLVYADWLEDHGDVELAAFIRAPFGGGPYLAKNWTKEYRRRRQLALRLVGDALPKSCRAYLWDKPDLRAGLDLTGVTDDLVMEGNPGDVALVVRHGFVTEVGCHQRLFRRLAGALFRRCPIVDVRLFEQPGTSDDNTPDPGPPYHAIWVSHAPSAVPTGDIAPDLFNHLTGEVPGRTFWGDESAGYPTDADAHRALSAACVRWGREQARAGN
jgi:uncharacterized protein (TIGR02996 family)